MTERESTKLNRDGNRRGMHPNSRKQLRPNLKGRPIEDTITSHVKGELTRIPTMEEDGFDGKGKTNAWWIARNAVRDARNSDRSARQEIWERVEGKVTLPIGGDESMPPVVSFLFRMPDGSVKTASELAHGKGE